MRIPALVTTAPRPGADYLPDTLLSLWEAGWTRPRVFAQPDSPVPDEDDLCYRTEWTGKTIGPWPAMQWALRRGLELEPRADALLVTQDDASYATGCRGWLCAELPKLAPRGLVSLYTNATMANYATPGWFDLADAVNGPRLENLRKIRQEPPARLEPTVGGQGAVAVVFWRELAEELLAARIGGGCHTSADSMLNVFCFRERRVPFWHHRPSLVRHTGRVRAALLGVAQKEREWLDSRHEGEFVGDCRELTR